MQPASMSMLCLIESPLYGSILVLNEVGRSRAMPVGMIAQVDGWMVMWASLWRSYPVEPEVEMLGRMTVLDISFVFIVTGWRER